MNGLIFGFYNLLPKNGIPLLLTGQAVLGLIFYNRHCDLQKSFKSFLFKEVTNICIKEGSKLFDNKETEKLAKFWDRFNYACENEKKKTEIFQKLLKIITHFQILISKWQQVLDQIGVVFDVNYSNAVVPDSMSERQRNNVQQELIKILDNFYHNDYFADAITFAYGNEKQIKLSITLIKIDGNNKEDRVDEDGYLTLTRNVLAAVKKHREEAKKEILEINLSPPKMVYNRNSLLPRQAPFSAMKINNGIAQPLQPPYEAFIELDERIYNPGDVITGKLHLELKKKLTCDTIRIQLFGSVRVFFIKTVSNSSTPGVLSRNKAYEQEIVLIDKEINVWEAPANGNPKPEVTLEDIARMARSTSIRAHLPPVGKLPGFEPGSHDFTFSFILPDSGLHTSFDSKNSAGCIRYYILMQALNRGYTVFRKKHLFPIVKPVFLDSDPRAREPSKTTSTQMVGKGSITATMELEKRGYVPGEPIMGKITIENNSKESIKNAFLRIVQTSTCCSKRPEMDIKVTTFESPGTGLPINKIVANSSHSYAINYYISALIPNFNIDACLSVSYKLVLSIGFARNVKSSVMDLSIPLMIGTHPVINGDNVVPKYQDLAPPPYYSNGYDNVGFAPPSYEISVSGRSEVNEEDDCDYTPLVYHYNFTNNAAAAKVE